MIVLCLNCRTQLTNSFWTTLPLLVLYIAEREGGGGGGKIGEREKERD